MTTTFHPISKERHKAKSWKRPADYRFASGAMVVPLAGNEVSKAALSFPIVFGTIEKQLTPLALLGVAPGQNLFVAPNGMWAVSYVPAAIQSYPFKLLKTPSGDFALGVDEGSGLVVDGAGGEPFYNEDGSPHERIRAMLDFLIKVKRGQDAAVAATSSLTEKGLLEAWPLKVQDGGEERQVPGLSRINEAALNALEPEAFSALRKGGALALGYAQLLSMGNLALLGRLGGAHAQAAQQRQVSPQKSQPQFSLSEDTSPDIDLSSVDWDNLK